MFKGSKITITLSNGKILDGKVESFDLNSLVAIIEKNSEMDLNGKVEIYIFNKLKGELKYQGIVNKLLGNKVHITNLHNLYVKQRRNEVRELVFIPINIEQVILDNELINLEEIIFGHVLNISISGLLLKTLEKIPMGLIFLTTLKLDDMEIEATYEIVRTEKRVDWYFYGCRLTFLNKKNEEMIRQYILRKQIQEKKKIKITV